MLGRASSALRGLRPLRVGTVAQALLRAFCGQLIEAKRAGEAMHAEALEMNRDFDAKNVANAKALADAQRKLAEEINRAHSEALGMDREMDNQSASMLRLNLFTYRALTAWLDNPFGTPPILPESQQLTLGLTLFGQAAPREK